MNEHRPTTRLEFSTSPAELKAGRPATWQLRFRDADRDQPVTDFEVTHEKRLHLIVVSKDLAWFNHVHPDYLGDGTFTVLVTLPRAGAYKMYADFTRSGGGQEVLQHEIAATDGGDSPVVSPQGDAETKEERWTVQRAVAHPEGQPDAPDGPAYQVAFMTEPDELLAGRGAMLHFQVRDTTGQAIRDLQPYLGALGHAVILSNDTNTFLHAHPTETKDEPHETGHGESAAHASDHSAHAHGSAHECGPDVMFHTTFPAAGGYKAWGEFKHGNRIIVAAFRLLIGEAE
jgi:hypothetical protein